MQAVTRRLARRLATRIAGPAVARASVRAKPTPTSAGRGAPRASVLRSARAAFFVILRDNLLCTLAQTDDVSSHATTPPSHGASGAQRRGPQVGARIGANRRERLGLTRLENRCDLCRSYPVVRSRPSPLPPPRPRPAPPPARSRREAPAPEPPPRAHARAPAAPKPPRRAAKAKPAPRAPTPPTSSNAA